MKLVAAGTRCKGLLDGRVLLLGAESACYSDARVHSWIDGHLVLLRTGEHVGFADAKV